MLRKTSFENKSINRVNIYIRRLVLNKNDIRNEYQFNWIYANEWKFKYNERKSIIFWNVDFEFILKKKKNRAFESIQEICSVYPMVRCSVSWSETVLQALGHCHGRKLALEMAKVFCPSTNCRPSFAIHAFPVISSFH